MGLGQDGLKTVLGWSLQDGSIFFLQIFEITFLFTENNSLFAVIVVSTKILSFNEKINCKLKHPTDRPAGRSQDGPTGWSQDGPAGRSQDGPAE